MKKTFSDGTTYGPKELAVTVALAATMATAYVAAKEKVIKWRYGRA